MQLFVYLARHGETEWNALGRIQGHTDTSLNAAGRDQAEDLASNLQGRKIVVAGASDLLRASETAAIVAKKLGLEGVAFTDEGLRERQLGAFEGLTRSELLDRFPKEWEAYGRHPSNTPPGGEPYDAFLERITGAVKRRTEKHARPGKPLLLVTHGGTIKALILSVLTTPALVSVPNGAVYRFALEAGKLTLSREALSREG
jgi:broad specificity phosphatase PhoE